MGYSSWALKESDTTELLTIHTKCHYKYPCRQREITLFLSLSPLSHTHTHTHTHTHRGEGHVKMEEEEVIKMQPQAKECWLPPETGRGKEGILYQSLQRTHSPSDALIAAQ